MILRAHSENWKERDTRNKTIYLTDYLQNMYKTILLLFVRQVQPNSLWSPGTQKPLLIFE